MTHQPQMLKVHQTL